MSGCPFLRAAWRDLTGLPPEPEPAPYASLPDARELERTQWSPGFERLMRNRLIVGAYRYGPIGAPGKPAYDRVGAVAARLAAYQASGNKELLVDIANLALLEFVECRHPRAHFRAAGCEAGHVEAK